MSAFSVDMSGSQIRAMREAVEAMGKSADGAMARAVNHTGAKALTQVTRVLTAQTGLNRRVIVKALKVKPATVKGGRTAYSISATGGNISLKYFGARETRQGVSAAPLGQREVLASTFMKAGGFNKGRVDKPNWNGQVFRRVGGKTSTGMDKFVKVKSSVYIAEQMVEGASAEAFRTVVARDLPVRMEYEMRRVLTGAAK